MDVDVVEDEMVCRTEVVVEVVVDVEVVTGAATCTFTSMLPFAISFTSSCVFV